MGRTGTDKAWKYCTMVDSKRTHVCCNFCGHTMWGGVSRFKEHLAKKRGDVVKCTRCPPDVTLEMQEHLIELSIERENKHKRKREELEDMKRKKDLYHPSPPPSPHREVAEKIEENEKALLDQAIEESLHTHHMEEIKENTEEADFAKASLESVQQYEMEQEMHRNSSSFRYNYDETDFDIDMSF